MDRARWIIELTATQRLELEALTRSAWREEADRARAVLWSVEGYASTEIAQRLNVRPERVRVWRCRYRQQGLAGLRRPSNRGGRRGEAALRLAGEILAEPLRPWAPPWTLPRLAAEIQRRGGITISTPRLSVLLRKKGALPSAARATRSKPSKPRRPPKQWLPA